ncbi:hypothetical protein [Leptospira levettii]|uniref:hypothetical protein n=1 Tax=Leptospira levettii TaxID=2023178 RepID=UPI001082FCDF|nr:hypothetical protein [Leptospira levettii]TGM28235.1 hypothetical protein EHQ74_02310 [Leptospira levettii]
MTRFPKLQVLEGENLSLSLHGEDDNIFLFGDESGSLQYQLSKKFDHLRSTYYSPLYKQYVPSNSGYIQAKQTLQGEDGNLYHFTLSGDFLGCSLCSFAGLLAGESFLQYNHYNADGTLAGITLQTGNENQFLYEGGYELSGFNLGKLKFGGGFKLPKLGNIKVPKMNIKIPKINIPKLSIPKINLPKLPNFKIPDIGKSFSNVTSQIGKGFSNIGSQVSKGLQTFENFNKDVFETIVTKPIEAIADVAQGVLESASGILSPNQGQIPEEQPQEEQALTPQDPGYSDESGYTASDGIYYSHDNQFYFDFTRNEWVSINQNSEPGFSDIGYKDENGYRSSDGLFYSHDGQYVLNEQTNEWIST